MTPLVHFSTVPLQGNRIIKMFGYSIPYLPDFLTDHTLLGESPAGRIGEFLERWVQFVGWLWKWRGSAFALRFLSNPAQGEIQMALIGRVLEDAGQPDTSEQVAADVARLLLAFGLPHIALGNEQLNSFINPFLQPFIAEVRQHEELMRFPLMGGQKGTEGYVVHPYSAPAGSLLIPFEMMLRQAAPALVSFYLEPTELREDERTALELAAARAETYKEHTVTNPYLPQEMAGGLKVTDPQMALAARLYSDMLGRMAEPFLVVAQIASSTQSATTSIARAFARSFTHEQTRSATVQSPALATVVLPSNTQELHLARTSMITLQHYPWGPLLATHPLERLRLLNNAQGAAVVWRLPINVRGGVPGVAVRQPPPDFEPGPRPQQLAANEIKIGTLRRGGLATATLRDFTRHMLITGFTGSGKTNTLVYLLDQLWRQQHIPFLVIESAKKEYRSLLQSPAFKDLLIFTLGDESTSPFRLNPFELQPGVRVEAHLGALQACFDAALPQFGILPSIIAETMETIYQERGWELNDSASDSDQESEDERRLFPTMGDMYRTILQVVEARGYSGELGDNIRAAAMGRIGNLLRGSRGRMFGGQRSFPAHVLFTRPVILELNDLNEDDKALVMMFLLMWLREYRERHPGKNLQHVTVIEEAHNVVGNVKSSGPSEIAADTKGKAVTTFANLLAEVRAYGEGIIISDQSPEKLSPDAMRNTNLQIAHQLRDHHDRQAMARAMIMDKEQSDYLGKLRVGEAAFFRSGMEKATFITIPEYKDQAGFDEPPHDGMVYAHMKPFTKQYKSTFLPFDGCRFCKYVCEYRAQIEPQTRNPEAYARFWVALQQFEDYPNKIQRPVYWQAVAEATAYAATEAQLEGDIDAAWCYFTHEIGLPVNESMYDALMLSLKTLT